MVDMIFLRIHWDLLLGGRSKDERRKTAEWQAYRLDLFKRFTLPSLQAQSVKDWRAWLRCDPALEPLHGPLRELSATDSRVQIVYDANRKAQDAAASRYDKVVFGRIDSDDMLHPEALARWQVEHHGLVQFGDGYGYDPRSGNLLEWNHPSSPFIAEVGDWTILERGMPGLGGNHGQVYKLAKRIDDARWYMVICHGDNVCNRSGGAWCGRTIEGDERLAVLKTYNIETSPAGGRFSLSPVVRPGKG